MYNKKQTTALRITITGVILSLSAYVVMYHNVTTSSVYASYQPEHQLYVHTVGDIRSRTTSKNITKSTRYSPDLKSTQIQNEHDITKEKLPIESQADSFEPDVSLSGTNTDSTDSSNESNEIQAVIEEMSCPSLSTNLKHPFRDVQIKNKSKQNKISEDGIIIANSSTHFSYEINPKIQAMDKCILEQYIQVKQNISINGIGNSNNSSRSHYWTLYPDVDVPAMFEVIARDDYSYVDQCPNGTYLAVFVHTTIRAFHDITLINNIRAHWKPHMRNSRKLIQIYFFMGEHNRDDVTTSHSLNSRVAHDIIHNPFRDVVQVKIREHYLNLTLKSIAMVKWAAMHCGSAKYIIKMDDDTYVNVPELLNQLSLVETSALGSLIMGKISLPHKVPKYGTGFETWHVDNSSYPSNTYPAYAPGFFYIFTNNITLKLLQRIENSFTPLINIEDIYLTGIVRVSEQINILRLNSLNTKCLKHGYRYKGLVAMHHFNFKSGQCTGARLHIERNETAQVQVKKSQLLSRQFGP